MNNELNEWSFILLHYLGKGSKQLNIYLKRKAFKAFFYGYCFVNI